MLLCFSFFKKFPLVNRTYPFLKFVLGNGKNTNNHCDDVSCDFEMCECDYVSMNDGTNVDACVFERMTERSRIYGMQRLLWKS